MQEGHEALMRQALRDLSDAGYQLPDDVDPAWLTLGNVRTDLPNMSETGNVPIQSLFVLVWQGIQCGAFEHPLHAMRCRQQTVEEAYQLMRQSITERFTAGCDGSRSWKERALQFGSALHTLQDSYCEAHTTRIDNGDPHAAIIAMHTYPSRAHPVSTKKDDIWQDAAHTAFKPDAAAAISATVAALKIFVEQSVERIDPFLDQYVTFREDIAHSLKGNHGNTSG